MPSENVPGCFNLLIWWQSNLHMFTQNYEVLGIKEGTWT